MPQKMNICTECSEVITNPVCERCYLKEIAHWMKDLGIGMIPMKLVLSKIKKEIPADSLNETTCIICGRETLSDCAYCFFLKVGKILKQMNFPDKEISEFLNIFNYRHYHEEYPI
jgi:hypothetical protein